MKAAAALAAIKETPLRNAKTEAEGHAKAEAILTHALVIKLASLRGKSH